MDPPPRFPGYVKRLVVVFAVVELLLAFAAAAEAAEAAFVWVGRGVVGLEDELLLLVVPRLSNPMIRKGRAGILVEGRKEERKECTVSVGSKGTGTGTGTGNWSL